MNYTFLCDVFRKNREYTSLASAMTAKVYEKRKPFYVSGLTDGSEHIFLQCLAADFASPDEPLVILFPEEKKAAQFRDFLLSVGMKAAYFPAREYCFSNITSSHETEGERLCVLSALAGILPDEKRPGVICTTADAVIQVTVGPDVLRDLCVKVAYDEALDTDKLASSLADAGYTRVDLVEAAGQFALRGGIVDVYAPGMDPVRIELFGDEIDRMGFFSPETQRFTGDAPDELVFPPVREMVIPGVIREEMAEVIRKHIRRLGRVEGADEKHTRAAAVLQSELASLENGFEINFADKYLPIIYPEGTCMLDYPCGPMVLADSGACEERTNASSALIEQSIESMVESYELPPMKNGIFLRDFDEIGSRQDAPVVYIDALARSHTGMTPAGLFIFNTRHVSAYAGNLPLFSEDLARFTGESYTCAVICSGEAE
ncbi:MAG: hypothetical protein IJ334_15060, partial [Clostridia bacterium]|nr:hypothetical protein [Clostridia bacterium]